jgi:adenylylsulfate kinase
VHETSQCPRGTLIYLTGIPASGKTTIAGHLVDRLRGLGVVTMWLDSDELRQILTPTPTYSTEERDSFYSAMASIAGLAVDGGACVVVSATAPRQAHRDAARRCVDRCLEAWVRCDEEVARRRDPKGLYERADRGEIERLPGVGVPYERPPAPELTLDSQKVSAEENALRVIERLTG